MSMTTPHPVATRFVALRDELAGMFPERRHIITAIILTVLAKQHIYLLGTPGTGKSLLLTKFFKAIVGARWFEQLLSKHRPSEALIGPIDFKKMVEDKELVHNLEGYLADVEFALLDELGKMSPTTGHDLLPILNERKMHQGSKAIPVPLSTCAAASNEIPTDDDNSDAAALWDRMLVRVLVEEIQESHNFITMLTGTITDPINTIDWSDLQRVIATDVPAITFPMHVLERLVVLREALRSHGLEVSGRRWKQSMPLLQASAFMAGRTAVDTEDIQVLRYTLWNDPSDIALIEKLTIGVSDPLAKLALDQLEKAEEIAQEVRNAKDLASDKRSALATELSGRLNVVATEVRSLLDQATAKGAATTKIEEVRDRVAAIQASVFTDLMGMDTDLMRQLAALRP